MNNNQISFYNKILGEKEIYKKNYPITESVIIIIL